MIETQSDSIYTKPLYFAEATMKTIFWTTLAAALVVVVARLEAADSPAADRTVDTALIAPSPDEAAIRANADKYVEAYNRRDSKTMADMWSPDAVYMDPTTDERIVGRNAIAKHFDDMFAGAEDAKLTVKVKNVDFVSPNVAIETGTARVEYGEGEPEETIYSAVHVKRDGKWMLDRVSEEVAPAAPQPPPSNYEHLKELEWLVGTWIDSDVGATIQTDCEWTKNRNFLTRSFSVLVGDDVDMSGMQIIGWDPAAKKIRSWVFDSEGGFAEGTWTRKGDRWFIVSNGTLADGRRSSAINVLTYVDDDSLTWQSTNREVDGEMLPNVEEVLVVRATAE
jgi:uncharacterized protein (TIGR02246 family)